VAIWTPLRVKVSIRTTVCPPIVVLEPFDGAVGVLVGPVGDPPLGGGDVGEPLTDVLALELGPGNPGGIEKGSRPAKMGLGLGPPGVGETGLPLGPTDGPPVAAEGVPVTGESGGRACWLPFPS
jgi:hypothetical protein